MSRRAFWRAVPAREISAELEALPDGAELTAIITALNQWQRQRPPKGGRTLTPLRCWLLDEARAKQRADPQVTAAQLTDALVLDLREKAYEGGWPEDGSDGALAAWDADAEKLLKNKAKPLRHLLARHL
jgi:hypothetical protein